MYIYIYIFIGGMIVYIGRYTFFNSKIIYLLQQPDRKWTDYLLQPNRIQGDIPTSAAGSRIGRHTYLKSRTIYICDPAPEVGNRPVYDPAAEVVISACIYCRAAEVGIAACIYDPTFEALCRPHIRPGYWSRYIVLYTIRLPNCPSFVRG